VLPQRRGHLLGDGADARHRHGPFGLHHFLEALPLEVLHHNKGTAVLGLIDVVHPHGVGVLQGARDDRLLREAPDEAGVVGKLGIDGFQGSHFAKVDMFGLEHRSHAALPDLRQDPVTSAHHRSF